ncbi:hypothetical protein R6Z07_018392 [Ovis aries]
MPPDWINPLSPEPAPSNLFESGPRFLRAALGPALGLGRHRGDDWRSWAAGGCGWSTRPLAGKTMRRGLGAGVRVSSGFPGARAASQHLDCLLFLVLKVVRSPPSRSSSIPPLPPPPPPPPRKCFEAVRKISCHLLFPPEFLGSGFVASL